MTKTLILMRHAKSSWNHPGLDDHDRPLNKRGRRSAEALGNWLRKKGYLPDEVLSSDAIRTKETLGGLRIDPENVEFLPELYRATANQILRALNHATGDAVLVIAHNPGVAGFAQGIVDEPPEHLKFDDYPTGATLVVEFEEDSWDRVKWRGGKVLDFVVPRELIKD